MSNWGQSHDTIWLNSRQKFDFIQKTYKIPPLLRILFLSFSFPFLSFFFSFFFFFSLYLSFHLFDPSIQFINLLRSKQKPIENQNYLDTRINWIWNKQKKRQNGESQQYELCGPHLEFKYKKTQTDFLKKTKTKRNTIKKMDGCFRVCNSNFIFLILY